MTWRGIGFCVLGSRATQMGSMRAVTTDGDYPLSFQCALISRPVFPVASNGAR
jgi:hypothetical protein